MAWSCTTYGGKRCTKTIFENQPGWKEEALLTPNDWSVTPDLTTLRVSSWEELAANRLQWDKLVGEGQEPQRVVAGKVK